MAELEPLTSITDDHPLSDLAGAIRQPISEDNPCGEDVKYDDAFQQLKEQINYIGSATGEVDYDHIVELGHQILSEKSKDLMTAGYLAFGLARTKGSDGLAEGLVILHTLLDAFWEGVHPQKPIRRRNALQFVSDRFKDTVEMWDPPVAEEREALELAQEALSAIQAFTMAELEENAPALSGIGMVLRERIRRLPKEPDPASETPAVKAVAQDSGPSPARSAPAAASAPRGGAPTEITSASDATVTALKAADFLREEDRSSIVPYRLSRSIKWGALTGVPDHERGVTRLEPPVEQRRAFLSRQLEQQEYQKLLDEGEHSFSESPFHFWLDLQRLLVAAARALGKPYEPLADALTAEVALLVRRLPSLPSLRFRDETPFADGITQEWLETEVAGVFADGEASSKGAAGVAGEDGLQAAYGEARKLLTNGDLGGALAAIRNGASADTSHRSVFRRRLFEATLCVRGGQHGVGRAILEGLDRDIERYHVATWEPELALEVWTQLHACYISLIGKASPAEKSALHERAQHMLQNIAQVDPAQALSLQG